jgi:hypothetical protein
MWVCDVIRLALVFGLATPALAETPMTAAEFDAWSSGHTLDYYDNGTLWGSEQHLPGRATLDADAEGPCHKGKWYSQGTDICFIYDVSPGPHCWRFLKDGDQVLAQSLEDPAAPLYSVRRTAAPLACPGPDVGV